MVSLGRFLIIMMVGVPSAVANAGQQMMRRQDEAFASEALHMETASHAEIREHRSLNVLDNGALTRVRDSSSEKEAHEVLSEDWSSEITICDRDFHVMDVVGNDTCTIGHEVESQDDCFLAASHLGHAMADNYFINITLKNPIPSPKGCLLNTSETPNKVYFNPSVSAYNQNGANVMGKKICTRQLYVNGSQGKDVTAACADAGTDYVPILEYDACWYAMKCHKTGDAPKLDAFRTNATPSTAAAADMPTGCYTLASTGQWGFNWAHKTGLAVTVPSDCDAQPVCYDSTANSHAPSETTTTAAA